MLSTDRTRLMENAADTIKYLRQQPHDINAIREHITDRIADGLRAATYDAGPHSADDSSVVERTALATSTASQDLTDLDEALENLAHAAMVLHRLSHRYPISEPTRRTVKRTAAR